MNYRVPAFQPLYLPFLSFLKGSLQCFLFSILFLYFFLPIVLLIFFLLIGITLILLFFALFFSFFFSFYALALFLAVTSFRCVYCLYHFCSIVTTTFFRSLSFSWCSGVFELRKWKCSLQNFKSIWTRVLRRFSSDTWSVTETTGKEWKYPYTFWGEIAHYFIAHTPRNHSREFYRYPVTEFA